jgi:hypothetical protein
VVQEEKRGEVNESEMRESEGGGGEKGDDMGCEVMGLMRW